MELTENVPKLWVYSCQLELQKEPQKETLPNYQPVQKSHHGKSACLVTPAFLVSQVNPQPQRLGSFHRSQLSPKCCFTRRPTEATAGSSRATRQTVAAVAFYKVPRGTDTKGVPVSTWCCTALTSGVGFFLI